ncbi:MAG: CPBP family intramembrane metalloprotease [Deltaproteobacteria bacterium]|nr:CPBP family intramembrane metalloprotease [Deltaproteobacteria bacterium]
MASSPPRLRRLYRQLVTDQLTWVDEHATLPPGRLAPETRATVVWVVAALVLVLMSYVVLNGDIQAILANAIIDLARSVDVALGERLVKYEPLLEKLVWCTGAAIAYVGLPAFVVRVVFKQRLRDYGLTLKGLRGHLPLYLALALPVIALAFAGAATPLFQAKYPFYREPHGVWDLAVWELAYASQFFSLEFFFRGFFIHGLKDVLGRQAIFAMVVPYVMIHFGKPFPETLGAILAGSVLGLVSLRTGSIAGGVLVHVGVAWTMDLGSLLFRG